MKPADIQIPDLAARACLNIVFFPVALLIACAYPAAIGAEDPFVTSTEGSPKAEATAQINQRAQELNLILRQEWEIINRLTKNRTVPVREGSREYFACRKAEARIKAAQVELEQLKVKLTETEPKTNTFGGDKEDGQTDQKKLDSNPFGDAGGSDTKVDTTGRRIVGQLYDEVVKEYGTPEKVEREENGVVTASWQKGVRLVAARFQSNKVCDALRIMDISGQLKYEARKDLFEKYKAGRETGVKEFNKTVNEDDGSTSMYQRHIMSTGMEAFTVRLVDLSNMLNQDDQTLPIFELYLKNDSKPFGNLKQIFASLQEAQNIDDL